MAKFKTVVRRERIRKVCADNPIVKQSFKDQCDINSIIAKYHHTGLITHVAKSPGRYGNFSSVPDYQSALNLVNDARERFMELPSNIRERFSNDPSKMIGFLSDISNRDDAIKLGLVKAPEVSPPPVVPAPPGPAK